MEVPETKPEELSSWSEYTNGKWKSVTGKLAEELPLTIFVNKQELVTILCTPEKLNALVVGYMKSEGFIEGLDDFDLLRVCIPDQIAEVTLKHELPPVPGKRVLTTGCGAGAIFDLGANLKPVKAKMAVSP